MTSASDPVVLSIGSNVGDRLGYLQSVVDGLGPSVRAVSPVYETEAWGGVEQGPFLNAVLIADDPSLDCHGWLRRGQELERAADRRRDRHWGPRTLDVDVITCHDGAAEVSSADETLTLPHPYAHQRAFVLMPWLAADPEATLTVDGTARPVAALLAELDAASATASAASTVALVPDGCPPASATSPSRPSLVAILGYVVVIMLYRWFPPITVWTGLSLLVVAAAEAGWGVPRPVQDRRRQDRRRARAGCIRWRWRAP